MISVVNVGGTAFYGAQGVCVVEDKVIRRVDGREREYLLLRPVRDVRSTVYIPTDNETLMSAVRPVLTAREIDAMLAGLSAAELSWIDDDAERRELCAAVVKCGDCDRLPRLVGLLCLYRRERGRGALRARLSDDRLLKETERLLCDEFAYALGIPAAQVPAYVDDRLADTK